MEGVKGIVTRSGRRLSVERTDKDEETRSGASTPTKRKPNKRLSIKPELEDVMETDSLQDLPSAIKLEEVIEENSVAKLLKEETKSFSQLADSVPDSPSRNLRKRSASTSSPEDFKKSPSSSANSKTPKIMLKKLENSLMHVVDSPKPRKKRNSIGGTDAETVQELTPLRRSRRLSTELNVVVEDPLREDQQEQIQAPFTRRGKRLSVLPSQPSLPEENEDVNESNSTPASPALNLNLNTSSPRITRKSLQMLESISPHPKSPSKKSVDLSNSIVNTSTGKVPDADDQEITKDKIVSPSLNTSVSKITRSLSISGKNNSLNESKNDMNTSIEKISKSSGQNSKNNSIAESPANANTSAVMMNQTILSIGKANSTSVSPGMNNSTPSAKKNNSSCQSPNTSGISTRGSKKSLSSVEKDISVSMLLDTKNTPIARINKSNPSSPKSISHESSSMLTKEDLSICSPISSNNTSSGKLNKSSRKSVGDNSLHAGMSVISDETDEKVTQEEARATTPECITNSSNRSQNSIRRSPRKNKSMQNLTIDDLKTMEEKSNPNTSLKNASCNGKIKLNTSSQNQSSSQNNVATNKILSVSLENLSNDSFKLQLSEDNDVNDVRKISMELNTSEVQEENMSTGSSCHKNSSAINISIDETLVKKNINDVDETDLLASNSINTSKINIFNPNISSALITEENIATSTPFVQSNKLKSSSSASSNKTNSMTEDSPKAKSNADQNETPKKEKTLSFTKLYQSEESSDNESSEEDKPKRALLDSAASDAGSDYQSGDSMSTSQKMDAKMNEFIEKGESLNSESGESEDDTYEKDSFICSSSDVSEDNISTDEDIMHEISLDGNDSQTKSKLYSRKLSKSSDSNIWMDESNISSKSQPDLSGSTQSENKSRPFKKRISSESFLIVSQPNNSTNLSKCESLPLNTTATESQANQPEKMDISSNSIGENDIVKKNERDSPFSEKVNMQSTVKTSAEMKSTLSFNQPTAKSNDACLKTSFQKRLSLDKSNNGSKVLDNSCHSDSVSSSPSNASRISKTGNISIVKQTQEKLDVNLSSSKKISLDKSNDSFEFELDILSKNESSLSTATNSIDSSRIKKTSDTCLSNSLTNGNSPKRKSLVLDSSNASRSNMFIKDTDDKFSSSFGKNRTPKTSVAKLHDLSDTANRSIHEIDCKESPKPTKNQNIAESAGKVPEKLWENSFSSNRTTDILLQDKLMEKRKAQPMGDFNSNIPASNKSQSIVKATTSTEFDIESVNVENFLSGVKRKLTDTDAQWTCTAGEFQVVKKRKVKPTRSVSVSDSGSTTMFKVIQLKKTPKEFLLVDNNLDANVANFKQNMLYGNRCRRQDSSKLLKMQQKLKASKRAYQ